MFPIIHKAPKEYESFVKDRKLSFRRARRNKALCLYEAFLQRDQ